MVTVLTTENPLPDRRVQGKSSGQGAVREPKRESSARAWKWEMGRWRSGKGQLEEVILKFRQNCEFSSH